MPAITADAVRDIMITRLGLDLVPEQIGLDDSLLEDIGLDSVDLLELAIGIEKRFGVKLTQEDTQAFTSVATLVTFATERQALASA